MKLGLILECQVDGPDEKVLRLLLERFAPEIEVVTLPQGNKANLIRDCGDTAKILIKDGCDRVGIVWDLHPADWGDTEQQRNRVPCLYHDRTRILDALRDAEVNIQQVFLVAIIFMLESWLIADKQAIATFLSRRLRRSITSQQVGSVASETEQRPKDVLSKMFERQGHPHYKDHTHAVLIAREIESLSELNRHCPTFQRFWKGATDHK